MDNTKVAGNFWCRAFVQTVFIGCLAFCCPGMFNALNGLGKAGGNAGDVANSANATLYSFFAVFGYFGGAFFNLLGNKVLMFAGGLCYAVYAGGIYWAGNIDNLSNGKIVAVISGAILGIGAGWFWTSQGAMMMSYATPERKGRYIGVFWVLFNLGGMFGGFLSMGLNWNEEKGTASPTSYFIFVGIMAAGAVGALALAPPNKVIREDGEQVVLQQAASWKDEILGALYVCTNRYMLLLSLLFLASNWFYPYQFNAVNGSIFNIRTRGFNSALYWGFQMLGSYAIGVLLDWKTLSVPWRAKGGLLCVAIIMNVAFGMGAGLQYGWDGKLWDKRWDKETKKWIDPFVGSQVDIKDSGRAAFPIITYMLYGTGDAMLQTYAYWVMGALAGDDTALSARFAGFYKGIQSAGGAIAWGLDLGIRYEPQFWICWILFVLCLPLVYIAVKDLELASPSSSNNRASIKAAQKPPSQELFAIKPPSKEMPQVPITTKASSKDPAVAGGPPEDNFDAATENMLSKGKSLSV